MKVVNLRSRVMILTHYVLVPPDVLDLPSLVLFLQRKCFSSVLRYFICVLYKKEEGPRERGQYNKNRQEITTRFIPLNFNDRT